MDTVNDDWPKSLFCAGSVIFSCICAGFQGLAVRLVFFHRENHRKPTSFRHNQSHRYFNPFGHDFAILKITKSAAVIWAFCSNLALKSSKGAAGAPQIQGRVPGTPRRVKTPRASRALPGADKILSRQAEPCPGVMKAPSRGVPGNQSGTRARTAPIS